MDKNVVQKLNKLNQAFYQKISKYWNTNHNSIWLGWLQCQKHLQKHFIQSDVEKDISILDIGCGTGRFATFLLDVFKKNKISYVGVDTDDHFLENASARNNERFQNFDLHKLDILESKWQEFEKNNQGQFDLTVLMGLLHHIPSLDARKKIVQSASNCTKKNGLVIFTSWRFAVNDRLKKRIVDLESEEGIEILKQLNISVSDLEQGDSILNWVKKEYSCRYSHYIDEVEASVLASSAGLKIIDNFIDDSYSRDVNGYYVCQKL